SLFAALCLGMGFKQVEDRPIKADLISAGLNAKGMVQSTKDPATRELAARACEILKQNRDLERAGEAMVKIAETTKDADSKWMAMRILGNLNHKPGVQVLLKGLSDPHHYVRANSARSLGDMRIAEAGKPITDLLATEKDGGVIQQSSN